MSLPPNRVFCKICDVREFATAELCANFGADYIGLHCISEIKTDRLFDFQKIVKELPTRYPQLGIVLVTRRREIDAVTQMVKVIQPSHVQLHAPWSRKDILNLRAELVFRGYSHIQLIGVVGLHKEGLEQVKERSSVVDLLILDRTLYTETLPLGFTLDPSQYKEAMSWVGDTPVFIAGGLSPENLKQYIEILNPYGVDVQTGVEYPSRRGVKDPGRLAAFLRALKS